MTVDQVVDRHHEAGQHVLVRVAPGLCAGRCERGDCGGTRIRVTGGRASAPSLRPTLSKNALALACEMLGLRIEREVKAEAAAWRNGAEADLVLAVGRRGSASTASWAGLWLSLSCCQPITARLACPPAEGGDRGDVANPPGVPPGPRAILWRRLCVLVC